MAKGCLESINPDQHVGGRRLGSNWYGVQIAVPIEWDEDLIRPYSNFSTIGDAIGTCVAWPHHLVILLSQFYFMFICNICLFLLVSSHVYGEDCSLGFSYRVNGSFTILYISFMITI